MYELWKTTLALTAFGCCSLALAAPALDSVPTPHAVEATDSVRCAGGHYGAGVDPDG
ncbi:MAG: hypothetical protein SX243_03540 [Acidobacteriota bacterium]|nr:hypothetical protein [Acidobacteriota bacterium]